MSPKNAIRRLLKSRLRLHLLKALSVERPTGVFRRLGESWSAVIEVEEGIAEDAWDAWTKVRASHAAEVINEAFPQALHEAQDDVYANFVGAGVVSLKWFAEQLKTFVFCPSDLMGGPCASETS